MLAFHSKHNLSIQPISGTLKGQYINLIDVAEGLSEASSKQFGIVSSLNLVKNVGRICLIQHRKAKLH